MAAGCTRSSWWSTESRSAAASKAPRGAPSIPMPVGPVLILAAPCAAHAELLRLADGLQRIGLQQIPVAQGLTRDGDDLFEVAAVARIQGVERRDVER